MLTRSTKRMAGVLVIAIAAATLIAGARVDRRPLAAGLPGAIVIEPVRLAPLRLSDHRGGIVTDAWFSGRWTFVVFGFTSCPDVCPATLAQLSVVKKVAAENHPDVPAPRYVFVTVDPARDTSARLAQYLGYFDPDFVGITGDAAQIEALEKSLGAFHRKESPSASGHYSVAHSGEIFLLDPAARLHARFIPPVKPAAVADQLSAMVTRYTRGAATAAPSG
jgi:protein SCO1/2